MATPLPLRLMGLGPLALDAMLSVAMRAPPPDGVNSRTTVQLAPAATVPLLLQLLDESMLKSFAFAPEIWICWMVAGIDPWLRSVSDFGLALEKIVVSGNVPLIPACQLKIGEPLFTPLPVSATALGDVEAFEVSTTDPLIVPVLRGAKLTLIWQLLPAGRLEGQLCVIWKSVGLRLMLLMASAAVPVLDSVMACIGDELPTAPLPKSIVDGLNETSGAAAGAAVPLMLTLAELLLELEDTNSVATRLPLATVGVKLIEIEQLAATAIALLVLQVVPVGSMLKSLAWVPLSAKLLSVMGAEPELVTVTDCAALLLFCACAAKTSDVLLRATCPVAFAVPVPLSEVVEGLRAVSLWLMLSVALRAPVFAGVKAILTMQLAFGARLVPLLQVEPAACVNSLPCAPVIDTPAMLRFAVPVLDSVTVWAADVLPTV